MPTEHVNDSIPVELTFQTDHPVTMLIPCQSHHKLGAHAHTNNHRDQLKLWIADLPGTIICNIITLTVH